MRRNCFLRAIGYSASLLDYFFRGDIDLMPVDGNNERYLIVNNLTENMSGSFDLYYDELYNGAKTRKKAVSFAPDPANPIQVPAKNGTAKGTFPVNFILPTDAKPDPHSNYVLVFKGTMGNENDAVAGNVMVWRWWREEWDKSTLTGNHHWSHLTPTVTTLAGVGSNKMTMENTSWPTIIENRSIGFNSPISPTFPVPSPTKQ
jgi:hypothetical protein